MARTLRPALAVLAAFSVLCVQGVSLARTSADPLLDEVSSPSGARGASKAAAVSPSGEARGLSKVCHISRHPRDGVPASEHACPLAFASSDVSGAARAD